jgi:hypothetical protein
VLVRKAQEDAGSFQARAYCSQRCFRAHHASTVNKEKRERALTRLAEAHVDEFLRYMRDESDEEATTR